VRRDLPVLIRRLVAIPGVQDLALTTNGVLLPQLAEPFMRRACGASTCIWIRWTASASCNITRRDELPKVLAGLELCKKLGYSKIKINAVAVKNLVEPDIVPLARFGRENGFEIRYMSSCRWMRRTFGTAASAAGGMTLWLRSAARSRPWFRWPIGSARAGIGIPVRRRVGRIGLIASVSRPFCLNCNRLRLRPMATSAIACSRFEEDDVKALLRSGASDEAIAALIRQNVAGKWIGHEINSGKFVAPPRPMYSDRRVDRSLSRRIQPVGSRTPAP